ncbi:MAG: hypothetical protein ACXVOH_14055, partial [Bacteroidia bacterium]
LLAANLIFSQQKTGKFASYEDYKKGKFMDTDEFEEASVTYGNSGDISASVSFKTKSGKIVSISAGWCGNDSCFTGWENRREIRVAKPWGVYNGAKLIRISSLDNKPIENKTINHKTRNSMCIATLQNEGAICLYSDPAFNGNPVRDDNGVIISLNSNEVYISKSITGEIYNLNKKNLADMVQDDPELAEFVKSKKFGKLKFHYVINTYNKNHK